MRVLTIGMIGDHEFSSTVGFGSKHDGVIVFSNCDGAVHSIDRNLDAQVLRELAGMRDGGVPVGF